MKGNALAKIPGGYIYLAAMGCPAQKISVSTSEQAIAAWTLYRDSYGIGASDMKRNCGTVYDNNNTAVCRLSYNGRIWDMDGTLLSD